MLEATVAHRPSSFSTERNEGLYVFDSVVVDPAQRRFWRCGDEIRLTARCFDLLLLLIRNRNRALRREELLAQLWCVPHVEDANLSVNISHLRRALGHSRSIITLPRYGYRFIAEVTVTHAHCWTHPTSARDR